MPEGIFNSKIIYMNGKGFSSKDVIGLPMASYLETVGLSFSEMQPIETGYTPSLPEKELSIKAVLLDIYGTLLISEAGDIGLTAMKEKDETPAVLFNGRNKIKKPYQLIRKNLYELIKRNHDEIRGRDHTIQFPEVDIISIWEQLYKLLEIEVRIEDLVQTALNFEIQTNKVWLMPHTKTLLSRLSAMGIPQGIVSNAQFYTPVLLEYLLESDLSVFGIDEEISSWSYKLQIGKPDLQIFTSPIKQIYTKYGIAPHEILYVGNDMLNDVFSAASSGLKTALFAGDKRSLRLRKEKPQVAGIKPDCVITDLTQILPLIQEQKQ